MQKVSNPESELEAGIFGGALFFANQDNTFTTRKFYRTHAGRRGVHTGQEEQEQCRRRHYIYTLLLSQWKSRGSSTLLDTFEHVV